MNNRQLIETTLNASLATIEKTLHLIPASLEKAIESAALAIENGGKICFAGNGGSASDSLHIAGELVGSFDGIETPLPAISFSADMAVTTSIANDLSFDKIFLQQARGLLRQGDLFWVISTSGNSKNLIEAVEWAKKNGVATVGLLGKDGGKLASLVEIPIIVPCENTQRIQEVHIIVLHILASALKNRFKNGL